MRARRALLQLKDDPLRTRRALSLYKVNGNSALLVLNGTSLICNNALLALIWRIGRFCLCTKQKNPSYCIRLLQMFKSYNQSAHCDMLSLGIKQNGKKSTECFHRPALMLMINLNEGIGRKTIDRFRSRIWHTQVPLGFDITCKHVREKLI